MIHMPAPGRAAMAVSVLWGISGLVAAATGSSPEDFAYRMRVTTQGEAAAYRVPLPLAVYQKVVHTDLADLRVFNAAGEQVPFAIERPVAATVSAVAVALPLFALEDDSTASLDAIRVTIESGRAAINLQSARPDNPARRATVYIVDGRSLDVPVAALRLAWPEDAVDFAGRLRVEAGDSLGEWRLVAAGSPVASLHSGSQRLLEQRVELPPTRSKYWRLSWAGLPAPFMLTAVLAEPAKQRAEVRRSSLVVSGARTSPGEFEYDLGAGVPVDRLNLELPDANTIVEVELQSRADPASPWRAVSRGGVVYRLSSGTDVLRNGAIAVGLNTDRHWLIRTDPNGGGLGNTVPRLVAQWLPHEVVFVARGAAPFYIEYGSATAESAEVSLSMLPKTVSIATAGLSDPEPAGGESRLSPPPRPFAWKNLLLWAVLVSGAAFLAWMAFRLARDFSKT